MTSTRNFKTCLIVEGGGFKTAFTCGILDAFIIKGKISFDSYIGVSGGAIALSYYLSGQYRFCLNALQLLSIDNHFMQYKRTFGSEGIMDIDYLAKIASQKVPWDKEKALTHCSEKHVVFVATNKNRGNPEYLIPTANNWIDSVIASCTLPFVTKGKHTIGDNVYFDGGWSDPLPVVWAYNQGYREILVLRTNPKEIMTSQSWSDYFGSIYYSKQPELSSCFTKCYENYNQAIAFMLDPPSDLKVRQIAPEEYLKSGTYTYSEKTVIEDYRYGLDFGTLWISNNQ